MLGTCSPKGVQELVTIVTAVINVHCRSAFNRILRSFFARLLWELMAFSRVCPETYYRVCCEGYFIFITLEKS